MRYHITVLADELNSLLGIRQGGKYIDCTLGDGGHTLEILNDGGEVLGLDVDKKSVERAGERIKLSGLAENFTSEVANFKNIDNVAEKHAFTQVDGIIYDLGFSSYQLEREDIGLSFQKDQPLDMRMDQSLGVTAADLVNALSETELALLFKKYGGEKFAKKFAKEIIEARSLKKIETTKELADVASESFPGYEHGRIHPATRIFLALRIAVNDELTGLEISLPRAARLLRPKRLLDAKASTGESLPGGRMGVITFHSLEDKVVKNFGQLARPREKSGDLGDGFELEEITNGYISPSQNEIELNPRARSAKLRVFERIK